MQKPERGAPGLSRRRVLALVSAAAAWGAVGGRRRVWGASPRRRVGPGDPDPVLPFEQLHFPVLRLPIVTANGAKVPVVVEMAHPMEAGHHVTRVEVLNERDPVPSKGAFHFTPANGQVYLAFQARVDQGVSEVSVTADCNLHGAWSLARSINVPDGAGGCAGAAPLPGRTGDAEILPPRIRIPQLVKHGRIQAGEVIDVQVLIRHPSRTGLAGRDGRFVQVSEPFHLQTMEVFYGAERVSWFAMTSALSDDPFITFRLRAGRDAPLRVLLTNSRGRQFQATHPLRVS